MLNIYFPIFTEVVARTERTLKLTESYLEKILKYIRHHQASTMPSTRSSLNEQVRNAISSMVVVS